jgi:FkbH-like protein
MGGTGLDGREPNLAVIVLNPELILVHDKNGAVDEALSLSQLDTILQLASRRPYPVVLTNLAGSADLAFPAAAGFAGVLTRLNDRIAQAVAASTNLRLIDLSAIAGRLGEAESFDRRNWFRAKAPFRPALLAAMAREIGAVVRDTIGLAKKCLVLDCDGTIWGGIVGEAGLHGIDLDPDTYPGNTYYAFQQSVVRLQRHGVMIALLSKNNEEDVMEVLDQHPHCLLSRDMIVGHRINWDSKPDNLRSLADELNIGVDSMVFVDDSSMECALMQAQLPDVLTIQTPTDRSLLPGLLARYPVFPSRPATAEDLRRAKLYREESERREAKQSFRSIGEFLASLEMEARIGPVLPQQAKRAAQLFSRTNQFMLTAYRPSEPEVLASGPDGSPSCYVLSVRDKFGDLGLVGTLFVRRDSDAVTVASFALSCRALGRSLERLFFSEVVRQIADSTDQMTVCGLYQESPKNKQVAGLYTDFGMGEGVDQPDGARLFQAPSSALTIKAPEFIKVLPNG